MKVKRYLLDPEERSETRRSMEIHFRRRSEISFRSLSDADKRKIDRSLQELAATDTRSLHSLPKLHKLASGFSAKKLYAYRATTRLRLVLTFEADVCHVEDIVDHDRLGRLGEQG